MSEQTNPDLLETASATEAVRMRFADTGLFESWNDFVSEQLQILLPVTHKRKCCTVDAAFAQLDEEIRDRLW
jgi:hypothetical protein